MEIKVQIQGMNELIKLMQKAPAITAREISKTIERSIAAVESAAKREAPVNKQTGGGTLRQKIRSKMTSSISGEIVAEAPYSVYVHEGTKPHIIVPVRKQALANVRTGQFFGKIVHHPGTRANPFMERAVKKSESKINGYFRSAIDRIVSSLAR